MNWVDKKKPVVCGISLPLTDPLFHNPLSLSLSLSVSLSVSLSLSLFLHNRSMCVRVGGGEGKPRGNDRTRDHPFVEADV